jgi:glycine hydroxymethyltransferase
MNETLKEKDVELYNLIEDEKLRQQFGIELIASENFTSQAVFECLGSVLTNKYSEGTAGKRYYGGNEIIDKIENLCIQRALKAYNLDSTKWGCNVQPYSGSVANLAVYLGLLRPHDRIMGLDLPSGGHLTHGFMTSKKRISGTSVYYESIPYKVNKDGWIDYDDLEKLAKVVKPRLIICGASAYSRDFDYERFSKIAKEHEAYLMADIAHISGFVATGEMNSPFEYCDIVTTTTHKSLRGPRAGIIFFRREFEQQINEAVFPGLQGGPHENQIAAIATQLKEVQTLKFKKYIEQVRLNAQSLAKALQKLEYEIVTNGTDNHLMLVNYIIKKYLVERLKRF